MGLNFLSPNVVPDAQIFGAGLKDGLKVSGNLKRGLDEDKRGAMDAPPKARGVLSPPLKPRLIIFKDILSGDESGADYVLKEIGGLVDGATDSLDSFIDGNNADAGVEKHQTVAVVNGGGGLGSLAQQYAKTLGSSGCSQWCTGLSGQHFRRRCWTRWDREACEQRLEASQRQAPAQSARS